MGFGEALTTGPQLPLSFVATKLKYGDLRELQAEKTL
jgi:hypothetical protein